MKKVISIVLAAAMVLSFSTFTVFAGNGNGQGNRGWGGFGQGNGFSQKSMKEFKDMKGHWGDEAVQKIQSAGIIEGYSDGSFRPDNAITEAELAVIINRLIDARLGVGDDESVTNDQDSDDDSGNLSDVPTWAKYAVQNGFKHQYFNKGRFNSRSQCNRLMACVAIAKALGLEPVTDFADNPFTDWKLMSKEDYGYLLALYNSGYISGYPDGNFNPNNLITRAQIAKIIEKLLDGTTSSSSDKTAPTWDSDSEITVEDTQADGVKLEWSGAEDNVKVVGYKISYKLDGTATVKNVSGTTATISGLDSDTKYTFTVEAKDAAGNWSDDGPSVTVTTTESDEDSTAPTWSDDSSITATAVSTDSVDLKWSGASDDVKVVSYKVTYTYGDTTKTKSFSGKTGTISGLDSDTKYTFTVEAKDAAGNLSDDGPSVTVTTLEKETPDTAAPTWPSDAALTVSSSGSGVVTVVWPDAADNTGVTAYRVYKDGQLIKTLDGDANNMNVTGLSSGAEYTFKVRAVDAAGNISGSLSATFLNE